MGVIAFEEAQMICCLADLHSSSSISNFRRKFEVNPALGRAAAMLHGIAVGLGVHVAIGPTGSVQSQQVNQFWFHRCARSSVSAATHPKSHAVETAPSHICPRTSR